MFGIKKLKEKISILEGQFGSLEYDHSENVREILCLKNKTNTKISKVDVDRKVVEKTIEVINWMHKNPAKYNVGDSVLYNEETCKVITVELAGHKLYQEQGLSSLAWIHFGGNNTNPGIHWEYLIDNKKGKTYTVEEDDLKPLTHEK